ncbi:LAMI_0D10726g1_1 [Lachancea mirantina]|uniref:LAMI_0D10726g1_1 n=1 Tax=Lachancea mirantina TaxID=1230905 RepID=A0A1G4JEI1_9SACH|nr:LAMI_0D10726g1_1 [Lachancea mirantina]
MTVFKRIPIWLDCDPGHDDAVAILLACFDPRFQLLGISASYGNAPPKNTAYNALSVVTALGAANRVRVYAGAQKPWVRDAIYAPDIHGESGLDGTSLLPIPIVGLVTETTYLEAIEQAVEEHAGEFCFVSTGSMTSVATLLREKSHLKPKIKYVSIMGGGINVGNRNVLESAEFNIWIDPQAANFLFLDPIMKDKCILAGLDLTHKAIATKQVQQTVLGDGTSNLRKLFYELFLFFSRTYENVQFFEKGPPVHDPLALLALLAIEDEGAAQKIQFQYKRMDLHALEDESDLNIGQTQVLKEYPTNGSLGTIVGFDMNMEYFWQQVYHALDKAAQISPI